MDYEVAVRSSVFRGPLRQSGPSGLSTRSTPTDRVFSRSRGLGGAGCLRLHFLMLRYKMPEYLLTQPCGIHAEDVPGLSLAGT